MKKNLILTLAIIFLSTQVLAFEFCEDGARGETSFRLISIDDMLRENSKEWTWQIFQKIEIEVRVENKNSEDATYVLEAIFKDGDKTIKISDNSNDLKEEFSLSTNERKSISLNFEINEDVEKDSYDLYIKFYKKDNEDNECTENSEEKIEIEKIEICENGKVNEDRLELKKIRDERGDNENEWIWAPGDNIKISLNLKNKNYSQRDFVTKLVFLNEDNEEIFLADNSEDVEKETNLYEDEADNLNFYFKLRSDIKEAKYTLYAKAHDKDDKSICTSLKAEDKSNPVTIGIKRSERKVIVTKIEGPKNLTTSSQAKYRATITNFGSKNENKVLAIIYNYRLQIKEKIEILNLKSGEEKITTFTISIPENASLARYVLLFSTEYEYNEHQDYYRSASDDEDDIGQRIIITQGTGTGEAQENKTVGQNGSIMDEKHENKTRIPTTVIVGNAIGIPGESPNWIVLVVLIILATIGIVLFFKKPKFKKIEKIEPPRVIRRYTAKLN